ncbi:cell envelope-related function transcriptional attenuator common domain-containing protein [Salinibacillus kushneri]|uniref:Cell envelope-related function transcriptional attenuator common domain-containing protein n=1 Tax=Salinibacillus kushneri TaxID=237682 RepID=A0A1H9YSY4_9BACI|nr:LCP family protein [Salinibacillus kushneri]SES72237.1 cell envelope-related function transcriptional attenuator common domain-containing protein [Salinibacillus kushneri]
MGKRTEHIRAQKKRKRPLKIFLWILATIFLVAGIYASYVYFQVKNTVEEDIHEKVESISNDISEKKASEGQETINVLLMGVDERSHDTGRADTLIVMSLNPNTDSLQMVSIPRDTYVPIIGYGKEDKINHSYVYGESDMTVATVENFLDIDLDYYVKINMQGLSDLVDAVGGITVDNPIEWVDNGEAYIEGYRFEKGEITLNGPEALGYARMRKQDPKGDAGRNLRQRLVIEAIIDKGASVGSVTKIDDILEVMGENVSTNMTFNEMKDIFKNYRNTRKNINNYQMQGEGQYIGPIWYFMVSEEEQQKVHDMITDFNSQS